MGFSTLNPYSPNYPTQPNFLVWVSFVGLTEFEQFMYTRSLKGYALQEVNT
jgi:hypothetical protein